MKHLLHAAAGRARHCIKGSSPTPGPRGRLGRRPRVESLESRRLLTTITEYSVPLVGGANGQPSQVTVGPNDTLYFAEPSADAIGSVGVTSPKPVTVQNLPSGSSPDGITLGPDGNIWYTVPATNQIGFYMLTGTTPPTLTGLTSNSVPAGITSADNYLWFTQSISDQIGRLNPITGQITEFNAPGAMSNLDSKIVLGPDGNLWFTEFGAIAAFDPNNQNSGPRTIFESRLLMAPGALNSVI